LREERQQHERGERKYDNARKERGNMMTQERKEERQQQ